MLSRSAFGNRLIKTYCKEMSFDEEGMPGVRRDRHRAVATFSVGGDVQSHHGGFDGVSINAAEPHREGSTVKPTVIRGSTRRSF